MNRPTEASLYLSKQLKLHPEWQDTLSDSQPYADGELVAAIAEELAAQDDEAALLRQVRLIRNREMVRIAWRDLSGMATLQETMQTTSDLADGLVDAVLTWWHKELAAKQGEPIGRDSGEPQRLVVLGMGKLGGQELNFSSDIDMIFAFPEGGNTQGGRRSLDNQTFFVRLGQKVINTLGKVTAEGFAYRVDMRLRPFGDSGALALSFDAMEHYYQTHGREWERYALVKARVMAGDKASGAELMQRLRPFVYRRYLDYGAVEQLRDMKAMINREAERKGKYQDVKLGSGGIREVEFTAQVFQLMRGGHMPELQGRQLLPTLAVLYENEFLSADEYQQLCAGYEFLRRTENRLQMWDDQQTHGLPTEAEHQHILAVSMGFEDWQAFKQVLDVHMDTVAAIFKSVFALPEETRKDTSVMDVWQGDAEDEQAISLLQELNYGDASAVLEQLQTLRSGRLYTALTETGQKRLSRLIPLLLINCASTKRPGEVLTRCLRIVQKVAQRSGYIAMLADNPLALEQFVKLVSKSEWVANQLTQHPILLDELLDMRQLYQPLNREELGQALLHDLVSIDNEDTEQVMSRLRQFKMAQVLRVAAADITGVLPLMVVSDQLTWIAEAILEGAVAHVWQDLTAKTGEPHYLLDGEDHKACFGIIGYGKLGGIELGYGSDLDIVFLHDSQGKKQQTDGRKPLENAVFYPRLAQRIIHTLATFTHDGRLYEIDTRLRPSGASGMMVTSIDGFAQYQRDKAWVWEHQALLRARMILGPQHLREQFAAIRREILCQPRDREALRSEVVEMRRKMWASLGSKDDAQFNLKKDHGGITDIEFMVQYLILANAAEYPKLITWSDNIRQLDSLREAGLMPAEQAERLAETYRTLRDHIHALALQDESAVVSSDEFRDEREYVQACWQNLFEG